LSRDSSERRRWLGVFGEETFADSDDAAVLEDAGVDALGEEGGPALEDETIAGEAAVGAELSGAVDVAVGAGALEGDLLADELLGFEAEGFGMPSRPRKRSTSSAVEGSALAQDGMI
jgi:hypothetical protein